MPYKTQDKPLCRLCQGRHWLREGHIFKGNVTEDKGNVTGNVTKLEAENKVVTLQPKEVTLQRKKQKAWEERNRERVRLQRQEYMRRYRATSVKTDRPAVRPDPIFSKTLIPGLIIEGNRIVGLDPANTRPVENGATTLRKGIIEDRKGHEVELDADGNVVPDY